MLLAFAAVLALAPAANAATQMVWGFPLGVTPEELRATAGVPTNVRTPSPSTLPENLARFMPKQPPSETWEYRRTGGTFFVTISNGRTVTNSMQQMAVALDQTADSAPADPLGLRLGDTAGALLIKSGAVSQIAPNSGVQIIQATIFVVHDNLRYNFQITSGRIFTEYITLVQ
jgi:hypothetical protein